MNPRDVGLTNTISRAELAAIAAAIIHGYHHIATDSPTSMHYIRKQLSHPNLHRHHIQGDVLHSIAKAIHQSPSPILFHKVKSHAGIIGNEYADALTLLLENQSQTILMLWIPPSKQLALRNIPSTTSKGLQRNMKNTESNKINQTQPSYLPQGFGTYPITMTPYKHTCTPSTN